jgi:hypothetical protein
MKQVIRKIGLSFVQGLSLWILIYIVIVHLFVVWKWDSGEPYVAPRLVKELSAPTEPISVMVDPSGELQDVVNPWLGHEEAVTNMVQAFAEILVQHQSVATTLEYKHTILSNLNDQVRSSSMKPQVIVGDLAVETADLGDFLRTANLVTRPTPLLMDALPRINKALTEASRMYPDTQWEELDQFFRTSYPNKEPSVANYVCPVPREKKVRKPRVLDPNATTIADLENVVKLIQKDLYDSGIIVEIMDDIEDSVREIIIEALDEFIAGLETSPPALTQCANEEQLMELIEQGLLALRRRAPLRNALKRTLLDMDPSAAKSIILDADLPMTHPAIPQADTINLRQVLDTQLLSNAGSWMDNLVDLCSGYNDSVDKFFDSIAGPGHAPVGEIILQKAGKVNVPHPKKLLGKFM